MASLFKTARSEDWFCKVRLGPYRFRSVRLCRDKGISRAWAVELQRAQPFAAPTGRVFRRVPSFKRWKLDVTGAGLRYRDDEGKVLGFHSLRVTLGTRLERLGAPIKARMAIMRHTDPTVSYGSYSDLSLLDPGGIVNQLPTDDGQRAAQR